MSPMPAGAENTPSVSPSNPTATRQKRNFATTWACYHFRMVEKVATEKVCPECEGRGWIVSQDGSAGAARQCECKLLDQWSRLQDHAKIPPRYSGCSFRTFNVNADNAASRDQLLQAKTVSQRYVDAFLSSEGGFRESGLLFIGPPGTGKTHLAVAVLRELIDRFKVQGLFVDFTSLIHEIQNTFGPNSPASKQELLDPVIEAEVLILDELGAQKPSPWVNEILYLIMNARYTRRLPTLFTTNFRLEAPASSDHLDRVPDSRPNAALSSRISPSLLSRLYEMARPIEIDVEDFRREVQMQKHRI